MMPEAIGSASGLQRQVGQSAQSYLAKGPQYFDQSEQFGNLETIFQQDRKRGLADLSEQYGIAGSRMGTPIAVGGARFLEGVIPRQNAVLGDLAFRGFESGQDRYLRSLGAGADIATSLWAPYMRMGGMGVVNPYNTSTDSPFSQTGQFIGGLLPW